MNNYTHAAAGAQGTAVSEFKLAERLYLLKYYSEVLNQASANASALMPSDRSGTSSNPHDPNPELLQYFVQMFDVKTVTVDLTLLGHGDALVVVVSIVEDEHRVLITRPDAASLLSAQLGYCICCITGSSADVTAACSRLRALCAAYMDRKKINGFMTLVDQLADRLVVYGTTLDRIPLIISQPGRLVVRKVCQPANMPFSQVNSTSYITVNAYTGDLLQANVDVIVSASDSNLSFSSGVSQLIRQRAGDIVEMEARVQMMGSSLCPTSTVVTSGGALTHIKYIIHAVGPSLHQCASRDQCEQLLTDTLCNCLLRAEQLAVTSIALPAIGSGSLKKI